MGRILVYASCWAATAAFALIAIAAIKIAWLALFLVIAIANFCAMVGGKIAADLE